MNDHFKQKKKKHGKKEKISNDFQHTVDVIEGKNDEKFNNRNTQQNPKKKKHKPQ